jgi:hypothetical protein
MKNQQEENNRQITELRNMMAMLMHHQTQKEKEDREREETSNKLQQAQFENLREQQRNQKLSEQKRDEDFRKRQNESRERELQRKQKEEQEQKILENQKRELELPQLKQRSANVQINNMEELQNLPPPQPGRKKEIYKASPINSTPTPKKIFKSSEYTNVTPPKKEDEAFYDVDNEVGFIYSDDESEGVEDTKDRAKQQIRQITDRQISQPARRVVRDSSPPLEHQSHVRTSLEGYEITTPTLQNISIKLPQNFGNNSQTMQIKKFEGKKEEFYLWKKLMQQQLLQRKLGWTINLNGAFMPNESMIMMQQNIEAYII